MAHAALGNELCVGTRRLVQRDLAAPMPEVESGRVLALEERVEVAGGVAEVAVSQSQAAPLTPLRRASVAISSTVRASSSAIAPGLSRWNASASER